MCFFPNILIVKWWRSRIFFIIQKQLSCLVTMVMTHLILRPFDLLQISLVLHWIRQPWYQADGSYNFWFIFKRLLYIYKKTLFIIWRSRLVNLFNCSKSKTCFSNVISLCTICSFSNFVNWIKIITSTFF